MGFLGVENKPSMPVDQKKQAQEQEMSSLVKARGFEWGQYRFDPNPNIQRKDGSIINGTVRGKFTVSEGDIIVFDREMFPERIWKRICTIMGFKYHVHTDIDKFTILPNSVEVDVSLVTPVKEEE